MFWSRNQSRKLAIFCLLSTFESTRLPSSRLDCLWVSSDASCFHFLVLVESVLLLSSRLVVHCQKTITLLESTLLHLSQLGWTMQDSNSTRVDSSHFESAWMVYLQNCTLIESAHIPSSRLGSLSLLKLFGMPWRSWLFTSSSQLECEFSEKLTFYT